MNNIICNEEKDCLICSNSFFSSIYEAALHKNYDYIEMVHNKRKNFRKKVLEEKLKNLNIDIEIYNYKEMRQEDKYFEDILEFYDINCCSRSYEKNIDLITTELKDWYLLDYYYKKEIKNDDWIVEFSINDALKERDRRTEKFLKRFFKQNTEFKEVPERKGCHCLLFFNPADPKKYNLYINDDKDKDQDKFVESYPHKMVFLISRNPRDGKLISKAIIKKAAPVRKNIK